MNRQTIGWKISPFYRTSLPLPRYSLTTTGRQYKIGQGYHWLYDVSWKLVNCRYLWFLTSIHIFFKFCRNSVWHLVQSDANDKRYCFTIVCQYRVVACVWTFKGFVQRKCECYNSCWFLLVLARYCLFVLVFARFCSFLLIFAHFCSFLLVFEMWHILA